MTASTPIHRVPDDPVTRQALALAGVFQLSLIHISEPTRPY